MLKKRKQSNKLYVYLALGGIFFLLLYITVLDSSSFLRVFQAAHKNRIIQKEVVKVHRENVDIMNKNREIRSNKDEVERFAREKMGMQKPNEKVFRFYKDKDTTKSKK